MNTALAPNNTKCVILPALIVGARDRAALRFLESLTSQTRFAFAFRRSACEPATMTIDTKGSHRALFRCARRPSFFSPS
jgi:hypothetical protein